MTAYDKNGLKILIHVAKDRPREDVSVMVVSVMSTNTSPVKGFVFQAAVPKVSLKFCYVLPPKVRGDIFFFFFFF